MFQTHPTAQGLTDGDTPELRLVSSLDEELVELRSRRADGPIRLSVVIPAYNEAGRIPRLFREIEETLDLATTEIIVVDDGSRDATAHIAESFVAELPHGQVIRLGSNSGKGRAVREGVVRTTGEVVMFMDADAATDLSCVEPLVASLDHHDIAIGSRSHTDATVERAHRYRAYMGGAFNVMVRSVAGLPFRDTQCGFKAFRGGVARLLFSVSAVDGFAFDVEVLRLAQQLGFSTTEIPVTWTHQSGSKIRHLADPTRMLIDITRVRMQRSTRSVQTIRITTADSTEVMRELRAANSSLIISNRAGYTDIVVGSEAPQVREMVLDHLRESEIHHQEMVHELGDLRPAPRILSRSASS